MKLLTRIKNWFKPVPYHQIVGVARFYNEYRIVHLSDTDSLKKDILTGKQLDDPHPFRVYFFFRYPEQLYFKYDEAMQAAYETAFTPEQVCFCYETDLTFSQFTGIARQSAKLAVHKIEAEYIHT